MKSKPATGEPTISGVTFYANNPQSFHVFLDNNPLIASFVQSKTYHDFITHLRTFCHGIVDNRILHSLAQGEDWHFYTMLENLDFKQKLSPMAYLILKELFHHRVCDNTHDVFNATKELYLKNIDLTGMAEKLKSDMFFTYSYSEFNQPISNKDFNMLYVTLSNKVDSVSNVTLPRLVFTGAHGSFDMMNNLSKQQFNQIIDLLKNKNIKFNLIVLECCDSATHFDAFRSLLSGNASQIIGSNGISTSKFYSDTLQSNKNILAPEYIKKVWDYNPTLTFCNKKATSAQHGASSAVKGKSTSKNRKIKHK